MWKAGCEMFYIFLFCSGFAALINLSVGYLLYGVVGLNGPAGYALSVSVAFIAGMQVSFSLNRQFTYPPSGRKAHRELADFLVVSIIGLLLTTGIAHALNSGGRAVMEQLAASLPLMPETLAHGCAVGVVAVYSFFAHKYASFRQADIEWRGRERRAGKKAES